VDIVSTPQLDERSLRDPFGAAPAARLSSIRYDHRSAVAGPISEIV
jgi:hypothetical protein